MRERSAAVLIGVLLPLLCWVLPATGKRRQETPEPNRTLVTSKNAARDTQDHAHPATRVPAQRRSPYSTDRGALDGSASRLSRPYLPALDDQAPEAVAVPRTARVRPYWTARERVLRWRRRRVLVLAAHFRLDLDTRNIHTIPVAGGVR